MAGCATSGDICTVAYFKPSKRDVAETKAQALAQNQLLQAQGCPERFSPIVGGSEAPPRPAGFLTGLRSIIPE